MVGVVAVGLGAVTGKDAGVVEEKGSLVEQISKSLERKISLLRGNRARMWLMLDVRAAERGCNGQADCEVLFESSLRCTGD